MVAVHQFYPIYVSSFKIKSAFKAAIAILTSTFIFIWHKTRFLSVVEQKFIITKMEIYNFLGTTPVVQNSFCYWIDTGVVLVPLLS